jgi:O-antigen/teichoic acid export membrane protein
VRRARQSRFARAFGLVAGSTAAGQLIGLFSVPALSRIYSTTAFGEYGVFIAIGAALSALACLRLDVAIPRADHRDESEAVAYAGIVCAALFSLALLLLAYLIRAPVAGIALSRTSLLLLPVSVFVGAVWLLLSQLAIRMGRFRVVAARAFLQPVVTFMVQGLWIVIDAPGPGLIVGYLAGQSAMALLFLLDLPQPSALGLRRFWSTIRSHRAYILVMTPQGVLNSLNVQLPLLMISWLYSVETTGFFSMTQRVMGVPIGLVGITMGQVYVSFLAARKADSPEGVADLFNRVSKALALAGLALVAASVVLAPPVFKFVLGPQWLQSARYAQVASLMYASQLIAAPLSVTLVVMRQEAVQAKWDLFRLGILLGCLWCAWQLELSPTAFVAILTVGVSSAYAVLWFLCKRAVAIPAHLVVRR